MGDQLSGLSVTTPNVGGVPLYAWPMALVAFDTEGNPQVLSCTKPAAATGTLTSDATAPTDGDTITIGGKVYTAKTALTPTEGEVLIGVSAAVFLDNLKSAINHTGTPGTDYSCAAAHPTVFATTNTNTTQVVQALNPGTAGNLIATTETSSHLGWGGAVLAGGLYAKLLTA